MVGWLVEGLVHLRHFCWLKEFRVCGVQQEVSRRKTKARLKNMGMLGRPFS